MCFRSVLLVAVALAGCGDLPRPFQGAPGRTARRLAQPPPARLAVAPPSGALLPDLAGAVFAGEVVNALVEREVPAVAGEAHRGDWQLVLTADLRGNQVIPSYTVEDPHGTEKGTALGQPVEAAAWATANPAMLKQAAASAAPSISSLLNRIEAERQQSDPNSLRNRPARLLVRDVTGAPGDGNTSLARNMRRELPRLGETVQDGPDPDFTVAGEVRAVPGAGGTVRIEIQWIVTDARGQERGRIVQINEVPAQEVNGLWGDVAVAVAQEAAGGVRDVVVQQGGARQPAS